MLATNRGFAATRMYCFRGFRSTSLQTTKVLVKGRLALVKTMNRNEEFQRLRSMAKGTLAFQENLPSHHVFPKARGIRALVPATACGYFYPYEYRRRSRARVGLGFCPFPGHCFRLSIRSRNRIAGGRILGVYHEGRSRRVHFCDPIHSVPNQQLDQKNQR